MFFVGKIMTYTNVTLAVRSEYYSGIKGRKNPKYCTGFPNAMKPIHRSEGVWFRQWALFQKNKNHVLRSEILMMKVAIANMSGTKWVNYNLMDETFYNHWQYRFIRLCQKTHPFVLYVSTFYTVAAKATFAL